MGSRETDGRSSASGYRQIRQILEDSILSGAYLPGSNFPSDLELTERFGVSRVTIRRAVSDLVARGVVVRHRGRGSFVAPPRNLPPVTTALDQSKRQLLDLTETWNLTYLGRSVVPGSPAVRRLFGLEAKDTLTEFRALRSLNGTVMLVIVKSLPNWAAALIPEDAEDAYVNINAQLSESGIKTRRVSQSIGAQIAEIAISDRLGVRPGSPILRVSRSVWDHHHRPISHTLALFRADLFEYDLEFIDDSAG